MAGDELKPNDEGATDYMDPEQVAKYLSLELEQVLELASQGKIPVLKFGSAPAPSSRSRPCNRSRWSPPPGTRSFQGRRRLQA